MNTMPAPADALAHAPRGELGAEDVRLGRLAPLQARIAVDQGPVMRIDVPAGPDAGPCMHLVAPDLAEDALLGQRHLYSSVGGWAPLLGGGFGNAIVNADEPEHTEQRRIAAPAFSGPALQRYLPRIVEIAERELDDWADAGRVDLLPAMRRFAFRAIASGVGGMDEAARDLAYEAIGVVLAGYDYLSEGREAFLERASVARARYLDVIAADIARRRAGHGGGDGTMTDLIVQAVAPGDGPRDAAVAYLALLLIAGHDTGMITYSRALHELAWRGALAAALRDELAAAGATTAASPPFETLDRLPRLERFMLEIGRRYPAVLNLPRTAAQDIDVGGYRIAQGTRVAIAVGGVHLREDLHADPDAFDPERYAHPDSAKHTRPFRYLAFAGGSRHCLGMRLAQIEFKVIVARALMRFDIEPARPDRVEHGGFWVARPSGPMPVRLSPRAGGG